MIDGTLVLALGLGISILLFLILYFKINAFISLLIASIVTGMTAGLDATEMMSTIQKGMGGTLGFVATIVGLGAIFGAILEHSGGAQAISEFLIKRSGKEKAPLAMMITGFVIAIPVFFDVAFIILIPVLYSLQRKSGRSLLLYAIPLLAGLAITHSFVPPTPGPVAVAQIINVDLGSVILIGALVGIPTALVSGLIFGRYISNKIHIEAPKELTPSHTVQALPSAAGILFIIAVPIVLILLKTALDSGIINIGTNFLSEMITLFGHPFVALIIANLIAWYYLGIKRNFSKEEMMKMSNRSFATAGTIILLTGAGGVFKQVLVDTEIGVQVASTLSSLGIPLILFAFLTAALIRVLQGSATVAMITAAGLVAPLLNGFEGSNYHLACIVIAIASGASIFSHVNDSGFWLVSQYLGMNEKQTFRSWSMMTTVLAITGFTTVSLINLII